MSDRKEPGPKLPKHKRLASGAQMYRANAEGRLRIVETPGDPISYAAAWELIAGLVAGTDGTDSQASEVVVLHEPTSSA